MAHDGVQASHKLVVEFWNLPATQIHAPEVRVRSGEQLVQLLGNTEHVRQVTKHFEQTAAPTSTYPEAQAQVLLPVIRRWLTVFSHEEQFVADPQQVRHRGEQSWQKLLPES